jgi:hypothetical protein
VPFRRIWFTHRFECAPYERPTAPEAREISSTAEHVGEVAEVGAAPALGHGDAEQPLLAQQRPQVARELVAAVDLGGTRRDALVGEAAYLALQFLQVLGEMHVAVPVVPAGEGWF